MPRFTSTRTWLHVFADGHEESIKVTLTRDAPSQAQLDAEAEAILLREVLDGFLPDDHEDSRVRYWAEQVRNGLMRP